MFERNTIILVVAGLVTVGAVISTLEWMANWRKFSDKGLFSWRVLKERPVLVRSSLGTLGDLFLRYPNFLFILSLRLCALLALLPALVSGRYVLLILGIVFATTLLLNLRGSYGMDGSDQMATHTFGALFIGYLSGAPLALDIALWYVALQSCLSYATSGLVKAFSPHWHRGDAVFGIFNTRTYGHQGVAEFLYNRQGMTRFLTWGVVAGEVVFPLALVVGYPYCLVFLVLGVVFHGVNAFVMGLNSFFWSFVATYPAILYCSEMFWRHVVE